MRKISKVCLIKSPVHFFSITKPPRTNTGSKNYYTADDDSGSGIVGYPDFSGAVWFLIGCAIGSFVLLIVFRSPYQRLEVLHCIASWFIHNTQSPSLRRPLLNLILGSNWCVFIDSECSYDSKFMFFEQVLKENESSQVCSLHIRLDYSSIFIACRPWHSSQVRSHTPPSVSCDFARNCSRRSARGRVPLSPS